MIKFNDLTPEQVQEISDAFAIREFGCDGVHAGICWIVVLDSHGDPKLEAFCDCPDYPNCKNAMHRIIEGMNESQKVEYAQSLNEITDNNLKFYGWVYVLTDSTAQQQFVAAAMALGILKEGEK